MEINVGEIVVIVGSYGSGKTEVSINLAVNRKRAGLDVRIADLDLVNPYFRTREARGPLSEIGIEVILPPEEYLQADLPILSPAIAGMSAPASRRDLRGASPLSGAAHSRSEGGAVQANVPFLPLFRQSGQMTLLDAGGDKVGATVLAALADSLRDQSVRMLQVVNPFRPFSDTVGGCLKARDEIENASKMAVSGIIGNANLIDDTTVEDIYGGYDFVKMLCTESGLPLEFITVAAEQLPKIDTKWFSCPVLPIERQLVPPWKRPVKFGPKNFELRQ
jgi:hypothetical protein